MKKGVQLIISSKATLVPVILKYMKLKIEPIKLGGRTLRLLTLEGGEASFLAGGVDVCFHGSGGHLTAFYALDVFEIRDMEGNVLRRNMYLCPKCWKLYGKSVEEKPSQEFFGLTDHVMKCIKCSSTWRVTR